MSLVLYVLMIAAEWKLICKSSSVNSEGFMLGLHTPLPQITASVTAVSYCTSNSSWLRSHTNPLHNTTTINTKTGIKDHICFYISRLIHVLEWPHCFRTSFWGHKHIQCTRCGYIRTKRTLCVLHKCMWEASSTSFLLRHIHTVSWEGIEMWSERTTFYAYAILILGLNDKAQCQPLSKQAHSFNLSLASQTLHLQSKDKCWFSKNRSKGKQPGKIWFAVFI